MAVLHPSRHVDELTVALERDGGTVGRVDRGRAGVLVVVAAHVLRAGALAHEHALACVVGVHGLGQLALDRGELALRIARDALGEGHAEARELAHLGGVGARHERVGHAPMGLCRRGGGRGGSGGSGSGGRRGLVARSTARDK